MKKKFTGVFALALILSAAPQAYAQAYPTKPVRFVFAFSPGSAADIVGRLFTQKLSEYWGQPAVPDNRAGAGGSIAAGVAAQAAPDGYTLLLHSSGHAVNPSIYKNLPYDAKNSFIDVAPLAQQPNVLVVPTNATHRNVTDFINAAIAKPGTINVASAGVGSGTHLNLEKFKHQAKIDVNHIPYKGSSEALVDVLGGRVDAYFAPISTARDHIANGKLRALAVTTETRSSVLPSVPTISESGLAGFHFSLWFGVWAPAGTPPEIVEKLSKDIRRAQDDLKERLSVLGNESLNMNQTDFAAFVAEEIKSSAVLLKSAGIAPQ